MTKKSKSPEELKVYDLNKISEDTKFPIKAVCSAINSVVEPLIEDPKRLKDVALAVREMAHDLEKWGSESSPRLMILCKKLGGVTIDTIDQPKAREQEQYEHNGYGEIILRNIFGDDYSVTTDGNIFERHLFIRVDAPQSDEVKHAA